LERVGKVVDDTANSEIRVVDNSWTCSQDIIKYGSEEKTKRKQVSSLLSEPFAS
jgi:hypothetical protein